MSQEPPSQSWIVNRYRQSIYYCIFLSAFGALVYITFWISTAIDLEPSLFIPAMLGLLGSFALFLYREQKKRHRFAEFVIQELQNMDELDEISDMIENLKEEDKTLPPNDDLPADELPAAETLSTSVYESTLPEFSRFDKTVSIQLINYYSKVNKHKATISELRSGEQVQMPRQEDLCDEIGELSEERNELIRRLRDELE